MNSEVSRYHRHRFLPQIICHAVWLYHRFSLSFRDIEDLLAERGVIVSYETVRQWCMKFGPEYAWNLRRRQRRKGDIWHPDEVFVTIGGERRKQTRWWRCGQSTLFGEVEYDNFAPQLLSQIRQRLDSFSLQPQHV